MAKRKPQVVVLLEQDGRTTYLHGVVRIPPHRTEEAVRADLQRIYRDVMTNDEWNYDDILSRLEEEGHEVLPEMEFWEHETYQGTAT